MKIYGFNYLNARILFTSTAQQALQEQQIRGRGIDLSAFDVSIVLMELFPFQIGK